MLLLPATTPTAPPMIGAWPLNTVQQADALDLLRGLPAGSVDCCITSPPYDNLRTYNGFTWDFESIARETYRVIKPGGVVVWVVGDATINGSETLTSMRQALYFVDVCGFRMHDTMVYKRDSIAFPETNRYYQAFEYMFVLSKGAPSVANLLKTRRNKYAGHIMTKTERQPDGSLKIGIGQREKRALAEYGVLTNVWDIQSGYMKTTADKEAYEHPAMFPEKLAEDHILTWTNPGDVVLDYFGGSGTTAKMARKNGRHFLTCDISAKYCDIMRRRLNRPYTPNFMPWLEQLDAVQEAVG